MHRSYAALNLGVALLATAVPAFAADTGFAGACKATSSNSIDKLAIINDGFANISTGVANVTCGAARFASSSPNRLTVDYYDGNNGADLWCRVYVRTWNSGETLWMQTLTRENYVGAAKHAFTIPTNMLGYVEAVCSLPRTNPANNARSYVRGFTLQ